MQVCAWGGKGGAFIPAPIFGIWDDLGCMQLRSVSMSFSFRLPFFYLSSLECSITEGGGRERGESASERRESKRQQERRIEDEVREGASTSRVSKPASEGDAEGRRERGWGGVSASAASAPASPFRRLLLAWQAGGTAERGTS